MALAASLVLLLTVGDATGVAASSVVECGQLTGYTAPDAGAPADGSVQLGFSDTWTILATATISPAAGTALPSAVNTGPTCLAMDLDDDGKVTALDFAPTGSISGSVEFDEGSGFYIFEDRLIIPTFITDANPSLQALVVTSHQAGTPLDMTFTVDTTSGAFTGFDGTAAFCGLGSVTDGGDGQVGDAIIPASVLDADDLEALAGAGSFETCATVHAVGTILQGGVIDATTDVVIDVAAPVPTGTPPPAGAAVTPPATFTGSPETPAEAPGLPLGVWLVVAFASMLLVGTQRANRRRR